MDMTDTSSMTEQELEAKRDRDHQEYQETKANIGSTFWDACEIADQTMLMASARSDANGMGRHEFPNITTRAGIREGGILMGVALTAKRLRERDDISKTEALEALEFEMLRQLWNSGPIPEWLMRPIYSSDGQIKPEDVLVERFVEDTDAMLERYRDLYKRRGWVLSENMDIPLEPYPGLQALKDQDEVKELPPYDGPPIIMQSLALEADD